MKNINDFVSGEFSEGYMGGVQWTGANSSRHLYGSDLTKAIRAKLKEFGLKGVTVRSHTYSGGQSITLTVKAKESNFVPLDEYVANFTCNDLNKYFIYVDDSQETVMTDKFYNMDGDEQKRVLEVNARREYGRYYGSRKEINRYCINSYKMFTNDFLEKVNGIYKVANSFNHNNSNPMVDYYDVSFYIDIYVDAKGITKEEKVK